MFQRDKNANKSKNRQKSKQTLMKKFENRENIFWNNNDDVVTSSSDNVDYAELVVKEKIKTKNLKVKRKYFILQERNKRFLKSIKDDEIETLSTRRRRITEIDENLFTEILKLKRQRSTINLKSTNLNIYNDKSFKKFKNWTRNAFNAFEINLFYFFSKWIKINWTQQFIRDTSSQRWNNKKEKNLKIIQKTWQWKNFSNFLINLIKNSQNCRFVVAQKYDATKQNQLQSVNDFVVYVEVLETDFDEFISIQQRNHLLNRLKKKIRKKFNAMTDIFQTRETLIALTQHIESSQFFKNDQKNKIHNDRNF